MALLSAGTCNQYAIEVQAINQSAINDYQGSRRGGARWRCTHGCTLGGHLLRPDQPAHQVLKVVISMHSANEGVIGTCSVRTSQPIRCSK